MYANVKPMELVSDARYVTARQYLTANLTAFNVELSDVEMGLAIDAANMAKRSSKAGLRLYVAALINHHKNKAVK